MNQIPCPGRIFFDLGDAFTTGCAFGSIWYLIKGSSFYHQVPIIPSEKKG